MVHTMLLSKLLVAAMVLIPFVGELRAQDAGDSDATALAISPDHDEELRIYRLKHSNAKSVMNAQIGRSSGPSQLPFGPPTITYLPPGSSTPRLADTG